MPDPQSAAVSARQRLPKIDFARGLALIGVMAYHLSWDLRYAEFVLWPIDSNWGWIAAQKALVSAFIGLSGLSLWLAHGYGINWHAFWRRWLILAGAALLVTVSTYVTYPDAFVYFGVLHALALFALTGLPLLRLRARVLLILGAVIIAFGAGFHEVAFNEKPLSWLGFWEVPPYTNDLVPVFPWFGVFLLGIACGRTLTHPAPRSLLAGAAPWGGAGRALGWIGRHSLILYLVHQPLLLGVLVPIETILQPQTWHRAERFVGECETSCGFGGTDPAYCRRYCACSLDQVEQGDLWEAITRIDPTPEQMNEMNAMTTLCTAMGRTAGQH